MLVKPGVYEFSFDLGLFPLSAIKKAAYSFGGHYCTELIPVDSSHVTVRLSQLGKGTPRRDAAAFPNEVIDQELRDTIGEATRAIRELILAQALSGLSLVDPIGESADFRDDPLAISKSDQQRKADDGTQ